MTTARSFSTRSVSKFFPVAALLVATIGLAHGDSVLPPGSVVEPPGDRSAAIRMSSELAGGRQSPLVALGGAAFASPLLFGPAAQAAGITCNGCHSNGHVNQAFYIPGFSGHPGSFDSSSAPFNPRADNGVHDPVDIPSLRGIRHLGPYGRDGRFGSLREFAHHVITDEFGGPEPSPLILDALAAWMSELDFVRNPRITAFGRLAPGASQSEWRGQALFNAPQEAMGGQSCAACHVPSAAFTDGRSHNVGTGGLFRTPTLLNANSSAPYFHDGRAADYPAVLAHFSETLGLNFSAEQQADLLAYLTAIGDGEDMWEPPSFRRDMSDLAVWVDLLATTLRGGEASVTRFVADTVRHDLARVARNWPQGDTSVRADRRREKFEPDRLSALLVDVAVAGEAGDAARGLAALREYYRLADAMVANYPRSAALD